MTQTEQHQFQAETNKLLNIIIHSIYTNKEIFLRELVSNSSDALDKVRFEINRGVEVIEPDQDLEISLHVDSENKKLIIRDTGIGMSREDVVNNLGTIAKSGTEEFLKKVSEEKENPDNIIGQFGVGFYSVFMVADKVQIKTQSAYPGTAPVFWSSDGMGSFDIGEPEEQISRGTQIEVFINQENEEYLDAEKIKSIIKRHSNFISFPIYVEEEKVNTISALWKESKFNISTEQYNEFYKFLTYSSEDPFETIHISVDAPVQFNSILFIPEHGTGMFDPYNMEYGLDLYVNRILIQRKNQELIPQHLGFLEGVVDTEDLPLNLSRQAIQENALIRKINSTISKQVFGRLEKIAQNEPERYNKFWNEHGKILKLGYMDFENRDKFCELLRYNSSCFDDADGLTSLSEYVQRMKEGQKEIYFVSGQSRENIVSNPHLELFKDKGLEVLYLFEPVDEFVLQAIGSYQEYPLKSVEHVDPNDLEQFESSQEKKEELSEDEEKDLDKLLEKMKEILGDQVTEVRASKRLNQSPACLVSPDSGMSSQMQRIMQVVNKDNSVPKQIMEVNPNHPLSKNLLKVYNKNPEDEFIKTATTQLFESALLLAGYLSDPHSLVNRNFSLLENASKWYTQSREM